MFLEANPPQKLLPLMLVASLFTGSALARQVLFEFEGDQMSGRFGHAVSPSLDVNLDGVMDLIVGAPLENSANHSQAGNATIYSGLDGSVLHEFTGLYWHDQSGFALSPLGDIDGDGHADVAIGSGRTYTRVHSGRDGRLLYTFSISGPGLAPAGDVNNDGFPDLIAGSGSPYSSYQGRVKVYSGAEGSLLHHLTDGVGGDGFGQAVIGVGDFDLDGTDDFAVGVPNPFIVGRGSIRVFSGSSGVQILRIDGDDPGDRMGHSLALAGDLDGDGFAELFAGAPGDDGAAPDSGLARVFSGATGAALFEFHGEATGDAFGHSLDAGFDLDGDGVGDYVVGAPAAGGRGRIVAYSGQDGEPLLSRDGPYALAELGHSVRALGDLNQDGRADLIIGVPGWGAHGYEEGSALVLSGRCGASLTLGQSCAGTGGFRPKLTLTALAGCFVPGSGIRIDITEGLGGPNVPVFLLVGFSEASLALPNGCALVVAPPPVSLLFPLGDLTGVGNGNGSLSVSTPGVGSPGTLFLQAVIADSFEGLVTTNGERLVLRP